MNYLRKAGIGLALTGLGGALAIVPAHAQVNLLQNGTFAAPAESSQTYTYLNNQTVDSWTYAPDSGIINPPSGFGSGPAAPAGESQYAFIQSYGGTLLNNGNNMGSLSQTLTSPLAAGTYNFSLLLAGRDTSGGGSDPFDGNTSDVVELYNGTTLLDTSSTFTTTTGQGFDPESGQFVLTSAVSDPILVIQNTSADSVTSTVSDDHTAFVANAYFGVAPEPAQLAPFAFIGLGLGGLILRARKRRLAA